MQRPFFVYHMPSFTFPGVPDSQRFEHVASTVLAAEEAGFDLVTVMDHFYQIPGVGAEEEPMLEAYSTLAALAARTSRIRLGAMVSGVTYHNPALLAKTVTTLDTISGGRAVLGLGAAWYEAEHVGLGVTFPPIGERMDRLEEALQICRLMFTTERPSFEGRFYRIERALNNPRPLQPGGPKILVGGVGERRTLQLVARYADIANWFGTFEEVMHLREVLERHCEAEGRDPATILRTVSLPIVLARDAAGAARTLARLPAGRRASMTTPTPAQAADLLQPYMDAGFGGFVLRNIQLPPENMDLAAELIRMLS